MLDIANPLSCGKGLDNSDLNDNLEIHLSILDALEIPSLSCITISAHFTNPVDRALPALSIRQVYRRREVLP